MSMRLVKRAENHQHQPLRPLPESDFRGRHQRFGARLRVADHHRSGHGRSGQHRVPEAVHLRVVDEQTKKKHQVGVTVENGIEESAEERNAILPARHRPIEQVAQAREDHAAAGSRKPPSGEKHSRPKICDQRAPGDDVRRDSRGSQKGRESVNGPGEIPADGAG